MAKLPALVSALAKVDGRERKTIDHIARTIRERGYITTGKRGAGAADMTPREAANLMIALNGADTPKDGPTAIDRFRSLRQSFEGTAKDFRARADSYDTHIGPVQNIMDVHTFGEALDGLIEDVPELVRALRQKALNLFQGLDNENFDLLVRMRAFGVDITFRRYAAMIEFYHFLAGHRCVDFEASFVQDPDRLMSGFYGKGGPDRRVSVTIGTPTLIAAWTALNPDTSLPELPNWIAESGDDEEPPE